MFFKNFKKKSSFKPSNLSLTTSHNSIDFFSPFKIQNKSFGPPLPRESLLKDLEISGKLFIDFATILFKSSKLS